MDQFYAATWSLFTLRLTQLVPIFFFRMDHSENLREEDQILGHWVIFLNIINVEADHGATKTKIRETLYGQPVR